MGVDRSSLSTNVRVFSLSTKEKGRLLLVIRSSRRPFRSWGTYVFVNNIIVESCRVFSSTCESTRTRARKDACSCRRTTGNHPSHAVSQWLHVTHLQALLAVSLIYEGDWAAAKWQSAVLPTVLDTASTAVTIAMQMARN